MLFKTLCYSLASAIFHALRYLYYYKQRHFIKMANYKIKARFKEKEKVALHEAKSFHERAAIEIKLKLNANQMPTAKNLKNKKNVVVVKKAEEKKWEWLCCKVCFSPLPYWVGCGRLGVRNE